MFEAIPAEVKAIPHWILWRYVWRPEKAKWTKVPLSATTGHTASVTNQAEFTTFATCSKCVQDFYKPTVIDGMGFVFGFGTNITGVDFDNVFAQDGQILDHRSVAMANHFNSYTEYSPSGRGLHTLVNAKYDGGTRVGNVEIYGTGRFFTMTGNPYGEPRALTWRQEYVEQLVSEIEEQRQIKSGTPLDWSVPAKYNDLELFNMARGAANGDKFFNLWNGNWQQYYASQSEADFAIINILAFYSDSPTQVRDLFMQCGLGQRGKARERVGYVVGMIQRSFDRKVPLVTVPTITATITPMPTMVAAAQQEFDLEPEETEEKQALAEKPYTCPEGLVGRLSTWFYAQALYPMEELAIVAALGVMAGICGRQYQLQAQGLNLYVMLLAGTGSGKDVLSQGTSRLFQAVCEPANTLVIPGQSAPMGFDAARSFQGPQALTGRGLLRHFAKSTTLSCVSVVPEFSQTMSQMADPRAHSGLREFQQALLDLYNKSAAGASFLGSMNAEKEKDIAALQSPAYTIVCEGTPERFWRAMTEHMVTDGLMSRFIVIEREGYDMPEQGDHFQSVAVPTHIKDEISTLCETVLKMKQNNDTRIEVKYTPEAQEYQTTLRRWYRQRGTSGTQEVHRVLWLRAHQNLTRIAALLAIGCDRVSPTVTVDQLDWANKIVYRQVTLVVGKFRKGEIGTVDNSENEQEKTCRIIIDRWIKLNPDSLKDKREQDARMAGLVPLSYILQRAYNYACFKQAKVGRNEAVRRIVQVFERTGFLQRVVLNGHTGDYYRVNI